MIGPNGDKKILPEQWANHVVDGTREKQNSEQGQQDVYEQRAHPPAYHCTQGYHNARFAMGGNCF